MLYNLRITYTNNSWTLLWKDIGVTALIPLKDEKGNLIRGRENKLKAKIAAELYLDGKCPQWRVLADL